MRRLTSAAIASALFGAVVVVVVFVVEKPAEADLDPKDCSSASQQVFTSRADRVRVVIPRGWCATDHASYPGLLVSMLHAVPPGQIMLTSEPFTRELYCSWPVACRNQPTPTAKYVCAIRDRLAASGMRVGPPQKGPKENEDAGLPSLWFEYDNGKRFLRQAVAMTGDRALSLVLATPTTEARTTHGRLGGAFDQALRTLSVLTAAQLAPVGATDAGVPDDAVLDDAGQPIVVDGGAPAAPPPRPPPIGACPTVR